MIGNNVSMHNNIRTLRGFKETGNKMLIPGA